MASGYHVQVTLPASTNLPRDNVVMTFALTAGAPIDPTEAVDTFFNDPAGSPAIAVGSRISQAISRTTPSSIKVYDLENAEPRVPIIENTFLLPSALGDPLPTEVAIATSFKAATQSGTRPGRRRGRMFLGPLTTQVVGGTQQAPSVNTSFQGTLTAATSRLVADLGGRFGIWSRANNVVVPVAEGWVDNEFDTQRRRGRRATSRTTWLYIP